MGIVPFQVAIGHSGVATVLPKAGCVRQEPLQACRMQDALCVCVCVCVLTGLPTACTQYCTEVPRDKVIGQTGRPGVHAAQPLLWLVMMINVGKCVR